MIQKQLARYTNARLDLEHMEITERTVDGLRLHSLCDALAAFEGKEGVTLTLELGTCVEGVQA